MLTPSATVCYLDAVCIRGFGGLGGREKSEGMGPSEGRWHGM